MKWLFLILALNYTAITKSNTLILNDPFIQSSLPKNITTNQFECSTYFQNQFFLKAWNNKGIRISKKNVVAQFLQRGNSKFSNNHLQFSYSKNLNKKTRFLIGAQLTFQQQQAYGISFAPISPCLGINYTTTHGYEWSFFTNQTTLNPINYYPDAAHLALYKKITKQLFIQSTISLSTINPIDFQLTFQLIPHDKFEIELSLRNRLSPFAFSFNLKLGKQIQLGIFSQYHLQLNHSIGTILSFRI